MSEKLTHNIVCLKLYQTCHVNEATHKLLYHSASQWHISTTEFKNLFYVRSDNPNRHLHLFFQYFISRQIRWWHNKIFVLWQTILLLPMGALLLLASLTNLLIGGISSFPPFSYPSFPSQAIIIIIMSISAWNANAPYVHTLHMVHLLIKSHFHQFPQNIQ